MLEQTLDQLERERAATFRFPRDRQLFIVSHGALRAILGRYIESPPASLQFSQNSFGKPALGNSMAGMDLKFNLAHSGDRALLALNIGREIGVDLEFIQEESDCGQLAKRFFSPWEISELMSLPIEERRAAFFRCWTRKEAFVKAHGEGLSFPLNSFDVSLAPDEPAVLLRTHDSPNEAARWSLMNLDMDSNFAAALAVRGQGWKLQLFRKES
ncbi:MAG: 4'-phosphopantetheinyl transferase superfamily protein [Acidobacteria bacterium]|nr:4'-phosphopantetheinyl transferase superfamily protein [Acidobacteriota bacterium]